LPASRAGRVTLGPAGLASLTPGQQEVCGIRGGVGEAAAQGPPPVQKVAAIETYQGTPVGFTADGHPYRGKPDAPLTLVEYTDYLCPDDRPY
jgi:protein-disulfide isomerase